MKYTKPKALTDPRADDRAILNFLDSLPAEFEIVPEGHVCVKWPKELTAGRLIKMSESFDAGMDCQTQAARDQALRALAAIAPGPRKRKADLWKHTSGQKMWVYPDDNWHPTNIGWRKVGECEIAD